MRQPHPLHNATGMAVPGEAPGEQGIASESTCPPPSQRKSPLQSYSTSGSVRGSEKLLCLHFWRTAVKYSRRGFWEAEIDFTSLLLFELQQVDVRNSSHYKLLRYSHPTTGSDLIEHGGTCYHWFFLLILLVMFQPMSLFSELKVQYLN